MALLSELNTPSCQYQESLFGGPSSLALHVTKTFLQEYLTQRGLEPFVDWQRVTSGKSVYFPLLSMVPADPLVAPGTASEFWHGASASRLACTLSAGRLVRGRRQVEGKFGVCLAADFSKALEYAPAFAGLHFVFHVDAFVSYQVEQLAGVQVLCREPEGAELEFFFKLDRRIIGS